MRYKLRQSFTFLPARSESWVWISKPVESSVKEFFCRRNVPNGTLSVKGPAKNELRRTILFSSHPSEPIVDERGLTDTGPCNNCNDINVLACPCLVQKSDIFLSTKNIASCNG